ncbi:hypothetical protein H920_11272 [Fukomys damarensis]|uniref:Uncharacterized protein n=1 Tax=Fukomys damarensis TaxID=885580 RepID=A0A091DAT0_FUKDA|nr:hypothetical protein H920_11272 [Fukomys damarensis]
MASSSPSSDPSDTEDCNRENKSALKLPGDCLPSEELSSCEDIILLEDTTPTVCSSGDLICPVQGRWGPEGKKRRPDLQQLPLEDPQQIYKPGISVAWADDNGFESTAHENQCRGKEHPKDKAKHTKGKLDGLVKLLNTFQSFHLNDKEIQKDDNKNHEKLQRKKKDEDCDFLKLTMVEDLRLSTCPSAQLSHQEHEVCLESPMFKPTGSTDVGPFRELSATPKGQQHAERVGTTEPSTSSGHLEDDAPRPPSTTSRLVGRAFHWLHQRVISMGRWRQGPEQATKSCPQRAPLRSGCLRGKRVHPDRPPEQLGPHIPTFSRYVLTHYEKYEEE